MDEQERAIGGGSSLLFKARFGGKGILDGRLGFFGNVFLTDLNRNWTNKLRRRISVKE